MVGLYTCLYVSPRLAVCIHGWKPDVFEQQRKGGFSEGDGFEKLAPFLNRPIPAEPYPHKGNVLLDNMTTIRKCGRV